MTEQRTPVQTAAHSVAARIGYGDLNEPMKRVLADAQAPVMVGAFVRLACEKVGHDDRAWWADLEPPERETVVTVLGLLEDTEAHAVAEHIRAGA